MFYISIFDKDKRLWGVLDTDDNVVEYYDFKTLQGFKREGLKIYGVCQSQAFACSKLGEFLFVPSIDENSLNIIDIKTDKIVDKLDFNEVYHPRNTPYMYAQVYFRDSRDKDCKLVSIPVCIKFDYEFTGTFVFKFNYRSGHIVSKLDTVYFISDAPEVSSKFGDYPDYITTSKFLKILKSRGLE